jgi:hypothetical protein
MSDQVQFDEDSFGMASKPGQDNANQNNSYNPYAYSQPKKSRLVGWLMKHGLAKTEKSAEFILFVVVIVNALITYYIMSKIL